MKPNPKIETRSPKEIRSPKSEHLAVGHRIRSRTTAEYAEYAEKRNRCSLLLFRVFRVFRG